MSCFACPLPRLWLPRLLVALCAFAAYAAHAEPATFLVGSDPVCDFTTVQAAVNAAATNPGPDAIHIANNQNYNAQGIDIGAQDLDIVGGFADCSAATPTGSTLLNGLGGSADSVFEVRGAGTRRFTRLAIANGDETDGDDGGGIDIKGSGIVELSFVTISGGKASRGGGIFAEATGGPLTLELKSDTVILGNTATGDGGGIWAKGDVLLFLVEPQVTVSSNHAPNGRGGGIYIEGRVQLALGSPGYNDIALIDGNDARFGGGLALQGDGDSEGASPIARIVATDPARPVRIELNVASANGGALYGVGENPTFGVPRGANFELDGYVIDGNEAAQGAVLYLEDDSDAIGYDVSGSATFGARTGEPSRCAAGVACNLVVGNRATGPGGAVFQAEANAEVLFTRTTLRNNQGAHLVRIAGDTGDEGTSDLLDVVHSAIFDNIATRQLVLATGLDDIVQLRNSTIGGNAIGATHVVRMEGDGDRGRFVLREMVVEQPGVLVVSVPAGVEQQVERSIVNDVSQLPATSADVFRAPARFIDPGHGDYRLQAASLGVDFAPAASPAPLDVDSRPRDIDLPVKPNTFGPRDLGAYERTTIGNLVLNDVFATDLRLWDLLEPTAITYNGQTSADAGTGSIQVVVPGPTTAQAIVAARQCVHLPGPGTYTLDGKGNAGSTNPLLQDRLVIQWALRMDADDCGGAIMATGEVQIRGGANWQPSLAAAQFEVPAAQFTANTTVEVRLVVNRNPNDPVTNGLFGRFDALTLTVSGAAIFRDGFE